MLLLAARAYAQTADICIARATVPPKIDGVLDDEVWKRDAAAARTTGCRTARCAATRCRTSTGPKSAIAYDDRNIYFAFHCFDNEPDKIRTNVSRRDSAFNDDWIAMSLDSAGTGQTAYHLFSNPSGSQMDAINTSASGEQFDADMVWYSAAKTTSDGYVVEMQHSAADAALHRRRQRADGPGVLPQDQPHRRVVLVAGNAAGPVGVRSARAPACSTT